jgi:hypothetical protein
MGTTSESSTWLTVIPGSLAPGGKLLAKRAAGALCVVGIAILAGCKAASQPESRRAPAASTTVQAVKSSQSNIAPTVDDCGLTAYPASRSTQEILAAVPQKGILSQDSTMFAKVTIDPEGRVTHLRVLRLAYVIPASSPRSAPDVQKPRYAPASFLEQTNRTYLESSALLIKSRRH